ncbi:MAG: outer membrane protein assembly factor BamC [Halioglobus sp.]
MRTTFIQAAVLSVLTLSATGCGYMFGDKGVFRDRSEDYKKAPQTQPLVVPEGMKSVPLREIYVIPPVEDKFLSQGEFEVPRPVPLTTGNGSEVVRIQKLGDESWALIGVAPGQVWPEVRNFMSASGMQIARADAQAGIMESNWLTVEGQPLSSRFQFRIDQGVQRGTSELHVLQMTQAADTAPWPTKSDDPAQAAQMLQAVAQFLANSSDSAPVSMIAEQGIRAGGKITLVEAPEGYSYLRLELPFDRAWASLGLALEKSGFEITDKNRSSGVYYVRYLGQAATEGEKSWWSSLWNSDNANPVVGQSFDVSMQSLPDNAVGIRLSPQDQTISFENREDQDLLAVIKGNID